MNSDANFCLLNSNNTSCLNCFYGPKCQFTTAYYGITSLQILFCSIESVSKSLVLSIFVVGSVCNLFSIVTFCQPNTREMGSGIYRLWISIVGQIGLVIVVSHLLLADNKKIGCVLLEYLRKAVHAAYDSLTACTTLERTMVIYQGITFNKIGSRRIAKLVIPILIVYHFSTILYEPFIREMKKSSNRSWCILDLHTHSLLNYESVRNMLHFTIPYVINFVSPIIWILTLTKQKVTLYQNATVWANFKNVLHTYKHTIISCYILVLFNTPRFIFTFSLTCIKFQWQNTAYITAYFLSLVPLMGNLFIFVIPSPKYRPVFLGLLQNLMKYGYRNDYDRA
ncbi:unnamed protein product [Adineta ricciae]|uniref:G-protein coupled receptors family 1 profile domain-containing protein n=1 Tax=Adineta ricciae TaxID=249248 RepID=A0A814Z4Q6_ADIRI|nr:unnamed protein product [Adineta ricciae]